MKGIVCHFTPTDKVHVASARIAVWLANRYGLDIIDKPDPEKVKDYDLAICVSSASGFADAELREQIGEICARAKHYIFAQQDFLTSQAGQIGKWFDILEKDRHTRHVWSTIHKTIKNPQDRYINWNRLTFSPVEPQPVSKTGLYYYGAARKGRLPYLEKYLGGDLPYEATVSTTKPGTKKFKLFAPDINYEEPFKELSHISKFQMSLYLEDDYSHRHYCSPANRWYECLSQRVPMVFDKSCIGTFETAGYSVKDYVVQDKEGVAWALENSEDIREEQWERWGFDHLLALKEDVDAAIKGILT